MLVMVILDDYFSGIVSQGVVKFENYCFQGITLLFFCKEKYLKNFFLHLFQRKFISNSLLKLVQVFIILLICYLRNIDLTEFKEKSRGRKRVVTLSSSPVKNDAVNHSLGFCTFTLKCSKRRIWFSYKIGCISLGQPSVCPLLTC